MASWLALSAAGPWCFELPLAQRLCAPGGVLFGGAAFAALVAAAETSSDRELLWAHVYFTRPASAPGSLCVELEDRSSSGRQSLLAAVARQGDEVTARAALSTLARARVARGRTWLSPPSAPPPEQCSERRYADPDPASINGTLDVRVAHRSADDGPSVSSSGRCLLWARLRESAAPDAAQLALLADQVPFVAREALGGEVGVVSLDSALRVFAPAAGDGDLDWVLLDVALSAIDGPLGHGRVTLWSEERILLAEVSQNFLVL